MKKCTCETCQPKIKHCNRLYKENMSSAEQVRFSSQRFWCQCGAWKYGDAMSCEDCWREQEAYIDR